jgi:Dynamin family
VTGLRDDVRTALQHGVAVYRHRPASLRWLQHHLDRLDEPLRLALAGKVKAGKSTLLNALVGEAIAATDAGECTRVVTWYVDGHAPSVTLHPRDGGPARQLQIKRVDGALDIDLDGNRVEQVDRLMVTWPSAGLRTTTLIDTPGIASMSPDAADRANRFLTPDDAPTAADAVLYLMRHLHAGDVRFLESFHDRGVARAAPVNTIAVLSRADEIGAGRIDALMSARRIAARYRADDTLRGLCQTVVAVAGLLAFTARTLRQDEYTALAAIAALSQDELDLLLLSADLSPIRRDCRAPARGASRAARPLRGVRAAAVGVAAAHGLPGRRHPRGPAGRAQRAGRAARGAGHPVQRTPGRAQGPLRVDRPRARADR